jgi:hypothetical protein
MKTANQIFLTLVVGLMGTQASARPTEEAFWVARLSGNQACERNVRSTLGEAVTDLETKDIVVAEAKTGRLKNRYFCSSCSCPDGTFNIVKVTRAEDYHAALKQGDWEAVKPDEIVAPAATDEGEYTIQPVTPEI